jgi:hypothetical protein
MNGAILFEGFNEMNLVVLPLPVIAIHVLVWKIATVESYHRVPVVSLYTARHVLYVLSGIIEVVVHCENVALSDLAQGIEFAHVPYIAHVLCPEIDAHLTWEIVRPLRFFVPVVDI